MFIITCHIFSALIITYYYINTLYYSLQDELVEQSSQGSFVPKGLDDILIMAIGTEECPGCARTIGFGVRVKQYFRPIS